MIDFDDITVNKDRKLYVSQDEWHKRAFAENLTSIANNCIVLQLAMMGIIKLMDDAAFVSKLSVVLFADAVVYLIAYYITVNRVKWKLELAEERFSLFEKIAYLLCVLVNVVCTTFMCTTTYATERIPSSIVILVINVLIVALSVDSKYVKIGAKVFEEIFSKDSRVMPGCVSRESGIVIVTEVEEVPVNLNEYNLFLTRKGDILLIKGHKLTTKPEVGDVIKYYKSEVKYIKVCRALLRDDIYACDSNGIWHKKV